MHRGTNIVIDNDLFLFLLVWVLVLCVFDRRPQHAFVSVLVVWFFGIDSKIGTALIPRHRFFKIVAENSLFGSICDPFLGRLR